MSTYLELVDRYVMTIYHIVHYVSLKFFQSKKFLLRGEKKVFVLSQLKQAQ